jgi:hypothetical protein
MRQLNQSEIIASREAGNTEYRQLWIEAVEQLAENAELKKRIEFLEREIATNAFAGWQLH